jgi:hypothetical protein
LTAVLSSLVLNSCCSRSLATEFSSLNACKTQHAYIQVPLKLVPGTAACA